jgi:hypothetical protein
LEPKLGVVLEPLLPLELVLVLVSVLVSVLVLKMELVLAPVFVVDSGADDSWP